MTKAQEEQHQLNATMFQSLTDLQRNIDSGQGTIKPEGSKSGTRRRIRTASRSSNSEEASGDSISCSHKGKRKRHHRDLSRDEFKKAKTPTFNGEVKTGQEAEAWLLGIKKYFQVHDYLGNMKARVAIFNMNGRESIWWENLRKLKKINVRKIVGNNSRSTSLTSTMMMK